jgi:hypothetical protein
VGPHADETPWRRRLRTSPVVLALAAVLTVAGCGLFGGGSGDAADAPSDESSSESAFDETEPSTGPPDRTARPRPEAPRPVVGDCRRLDWRDTRRAITDAGSDPTRCNTAHTAETFARGTLDVVPGSGGEPDTRRLGGTSVQCRSALVDWLGGDDAAYELSMFAYVLAVPTAEDLAAGARWWRCDVFATDRPGELTRLRDTTRRALAGRTADRWATCVRGKLDARPEQVLCRGRHDWRGVSAHRLGGRGADYPGRNVVADRMRKTCQDEIGAYEGDPLEGFDYGWLRPALADWRAGQRFGFCFAQTRD